MSDSKHTPGPWKIRKPLHPDQRQIEDRLISAGNNIHIAEVYQYQNHDNREANGTALANARLIAAAPELLEACKRVQDWLDTSSLQAVLVHQTEAPVKDALIMGIASHLTTLEAGIAKAEA